MDPIKFRFGFISLLSKLELKLKRNYDAVFGDIFETIFSLFNL